MKLLLENWRQYLNEEEYSITPEENQALKSLYIKIRPLLHHFSEWLQQNNIHPSEITDDMIIQKYTPPAPFDSPSQGWGEMKLDVSEFKSIFPNLSDKFYIAISDEIKEGELMRDGYGTIEGIKIGIMLFEDLQEVKQTIDSHNLKEGFDMWAEDEADGRQRVAPNALMSVMVKAVQELSTQVDELKAKLNEGE